jgi:hypothetical protein
LPAFHHSRKRYVMIRRIVILISFSLGLSACALPQGEFPSLLRRPYETNAPITAPLAPDATVATTLPSDLAAKANSLTSRHSAAQNAYRDMYPQVAAMVKAASGSASGSEAWVSAHLQVSRLDKARADSKTALAELDRMITAQLDADANRDGQRLALLLIDIQKPIAADTAAQDEQIDRLSAIISA